MAYPDAAKTAFFVKGRVHNLELRYVNDVDGGVADAADSRRV